MKEKIIDTTATCFRINYQKGDFVIALFRNKDREVFSVKGNMFVVVGEEYQIKAEHDTSNPKYENSYKAIQVKQDIDLNNADDKTVKKFLSSFLTEKQVDGIIKGIPSPIDVIKSKDVETLITVKGIGVATAERIIRSYESQKDYSEAFIAFADYDISEKLIKKICDHFGDVNLAISKVRDNAFSLTEISGIGFRKADHIYLSNPDNDHHDIKRVRAYTDHLFYTKYNDGHTWMTPREYIEMFNEQFIGGNAKKGVDYIKESDKYMILNAKDEHGKKQMRLALKFVVKMELECVVRLNDLLGAESKMKLGDIQKIISDIENAQGWEYSEEQRQAIQGVFDTNVVMVQGLAGTGKAQPVDTEIPTPSGFVKMGDLKVGDVVFDRKGRPTTVTGVFPQGELDAYEVILSDGRKTICNDGHLWSTYTSKGNLKTRTLGEMMDSGLHYPDKRTKLDGGSKKNSKYKIPTNDCVEYDYRELSIHPYVMGVLIGDGSFVNKRLTLSSEDSEIANRLEALMNGIKVVKDPHENFSWYFKFDEGKMFLRDYESHNRALFNKYLQSKDFLKDYPDLLCKSGAKRIPLDYLISSKDQRMDMLRGLMDTDGSITSIGGRYRCRFNTGSKGLSSDVEQLALSLGFQATISESDRTSDNGRNLKEYNVDISVSGRQKKDLFYLKRKIDVAKEAPEPKKRFDRVGISEVVKLDEKKEMVCIEVENEEHLYLTNDFIVTHNTSVAKAFLGVLLQNGYSYMGCTLSGKAADNLSKTTNQKASTIHSMLGFGSQGFYYNEKNKLPTNAVLLDELSMPNLEIFLSMLRSIPNGAKLIMLGDFGQLEAIGVGVMGAFIRSKKIPMMLLKTIHRQAEKSAIITHSIHYRKGTIPKELDFSAIGESRVYGEIEDLEYIFLNEDKEIGVNTLRRFGEMLKTFDLRDIQILCSTKKTGAVSCWYLNQNAQSIANPKDIDKPEIEVGYKDDKYILRVGDKVINTKNNKDTRSPIGNLVPIFNGNTGIVMDVDVTERSVTVDFDGIGEVVITTEFIKDIELGYAITIHKSQGSTIGCVIFALPYHYLLNSKELLYTGMTRAKDYQIIITTEKALRAAVKKSNATKKNVNMDMFLINYEKWSEFIPDVRKVD